MASAPTTIISSNKALVLVDLAAHLPTTILEVSQSNIDAPSMNPDWKARKIETKETGDVFRSRQSTNVLSLIHI